MDFPHEHRFEELAVVVDGRLLFVDGEAQLSCDVVDDDVEFRVYSLKVDAVRDEDGEEVALEAEPTWDLLSQSRSVLTKDANLAATVVEAAVENGYSFRSAAMACY